MVPIGKLLILFGIVLIVIGAGMVFVNRIPYLGKLPGDIAIKKENFQFYFPITTSIILSVFISLVFWLLSLFNKK